MITRAVISRRLRGVISQIKSGDKILPNLHIAEIESIPTPRIVKHHMEKKGIQTEMFTIQILENHLV